MSSEFEEIHTYKYIYMYEGRVIDEIDTSVAGNYVIEVEAVDKHGRVSRKVIANLSVTNEVENPIGNNKNVGTNTILLTIVIMASIMSIVIVKKRNEV